MEEVIVAIVGAGPSGLATSACLNLLSIPNVILEREDCSASMWRKRSYNRLKLHIAKKYCSLPHMPHSSSTPTYISRLDFIRYIDEYVSKFNIRPKYCRSVQYAAFDHMKQKWHVEVKNALSNDVEVYMAEFLVIGTGENSEGYIPNIRGIERFRGDMIHSIEYKSGSVYRGKDVLVVGCGNSGMEIAYDLWDFGAKASIAVRGPVHVLKKEMVHAGMLMLAYLPCNVVDKIIMMLSTLVYGDLSKHGLLKPDNGPFFLKATTGRSPVIDVGTIKKIKTGEIKVCPAISRIEEFNNVVFKNGETHQFDAIVFATGYRSTANNWLKDFGYILNSDGMPKNGFPLHWKGEKNVYCAGLSRRGLAGISMDAQAIADDINMVYKSKINGKKPPPQIEEL